MKPKSSEQAAEPGPRDEVPAEFRLCGIDDNQAVQASLGALKRLDVDHSGFDKVLRALKPLAWRQWCHGGNATAAREELERRKHARAQTQGRLGGLQRQGKPTGEVEAELVSADRNIARLGALIAAAGDGPDQGTRKDRLDVAEHRLNEAGGRLQQYRAARLPAPPELEDALVAAEDALNEAETAFAEGWRELEALGAQTGKLLAQALAASCETACKKLGAQGLALIEPDLDRLVRLPHRALSEIDALYRKAEHLDSLMMQLGATPGRGMAAFWKGCDVADVVVAGRSGIKLEVRPERARRPAGEGLSRESGIGVT